MQSGTEHLTLPDIYSRRRRLALPSGEDVYTYENVPRRLRVQAVQILREGFGPYYNKYGNLAPGGECYSSIVRILRRELGAHELAKYKDNPQDELFAWMEKSEDTESWIDCIEISLRIIDGYVRRNWSNFEFDVIHPDSVISELNARMLEAGLGYQFSSGEIIRIDTLHLHKEVVLPALRLLRDPRFAAAEQEYVQAHDSYRHGDLENSLVNCGKALESVLKVIGTKRGWTMKENDPASKLIQAATDSGFIAGYTQTALNHLKGLIESSTPTVRNKMGGHGAGVTPRTVPLHLAAFQLNQTAAVMVYLVEQDATLP